MQNGPTDADILQIGGSTLTREGGLIAPSLGTTRVTHLYMSTFGIICFWVGAIALVLMVMRPAFLPKAPWVSWALMFTGLGALLMGTGVIFLRF